jgi:transposase-like protein
MIRAGAAFADSHRFVEQFMVVRDRGVSYAQVSQDLNVHPTQLRHWVKAFAADPMQAFPGHGQMSRSRRRSHGSSVK